MIENERLQRRYALLHAAMLYLPFAEARAERATKAGGGTAFEQQKARRIAANEAEAMLTEIQVAEIECPFCGRDREMVNGDFYCEPCSETPSGQYS